MSSKIPANEIAPGRVVWYAAPPASSNWRLGFGAHKGKVTSSGLGTVRVNFDAHVHADGRNYTGPCSVAPRRVFRSEMAAWEFLVEEANAAANVARHNVDRLQTAAIDRFVEAAVAVSRKDRK